MTFAFPDRLTIDKTSPLFNHEACQRARVMLDGFEVKLVTEYCVSERWLTRHKTSAFGVPIKDRTGAWVIHRLTGVITIEDKSE